MKKLLSVFLFAVIAMSVFTGCSDNPSGDNSLRARVGDFAIVVDEFKEALLPMDNDGYIYSNAVQTVCDYTDGKATQQEAIDAVVQAYSELEKAESEIEEKTLDEDTENILKEYGIYPEEFEVFINFRTQDLSTYIENLSYLYYYLQNDVEYNSEFNTNNLIFVSKIDRLIQENNRDYYYYANINYWFVDRTDEEVEYLLQELDKDLKWCSVSEDEYVWENSAEIVEEKAMQYMNTYEEYLNLFAEYLGLSEEESEEMDDMIDKLEDIEDGGEIKDNQSAIQLS